MTLKIELGREMEEVLGHRARLQGVPVEDYALQVLQQAVGIEKPSRPRATQEEFRAFLDALARGGPKDAPANTSTFSREMIYDDHD